MNKIKSNTYELNRFEGILTLNFKSGDIVINNGYTEYSLRTDLTMIYDIKEKKITNAMDTALMNSGYGSVIAYYIYQLFNFRDFKEDFRDFVDFLIYKETSLDVSEATNKLMDEIMAFHKDNVIDHYLATGNVQAFTDLMNT